MIKKWEDLPEWMQCPEVKEYYDILQQKKISLIIKKLLDIILGLFILIITIIPMMIIAVIIKLDSHGPVFYRQERVTINGKKFRIHKFRTMISNADRIGSTVTVEDDIRITKVGTKLRVYRLDELPQVFDVLSGNMSFVGCRPEVTKYVKDYTPEMRATLLLPAGITSEASIRYKNEAQLLNEVDDIDSIYVKKILPEKMKYNLNSLRNFGIYNEFTTMVRTVLAVMGKKYE